MTGLGKVLEDRSHLWAYPVDVSAVPWDLRPENRGVQVNKRNFEEQFAKGTSALPWLKTGIIYGDSVRVKSGRWTAAAASME